MSYCLNSNCPQPQNPDQATVCQTCGFSLRLANRYRPLKFIAQGGFGRTLLAKDEQQQQLCIIKQFFLSESNARFSARQQNRIQSSPPQPSASSPKSSSPSLPHSLTPSLQTTAAQQFRQEAQRLQDLGQHPQIPSFIDYIDREDGQYLIQAFIDGSTLTQLVAKNGVWSELQVRSLLNDLLPVLDFMHQAQVIHRDIKPDNIIYPSATSKPVLVDFGAAKLATVTALQQTGTVIGSAGYAAPEQTMGKAIFASDIYGLGVTCLYLLTGEHPFELYSVAEDRWVWTPYVQPPVSSRLTYVLNKMTRRSVQQRYQSVAEVLADLNAPMKLRSQSQIRWPSPSKLLRNRNSVPDSATEFAESITTLANNPASEPTTTPQAPPQNWICWQTLTQNTQGITTLAVSPDGYTLVVGHTNGTLRIWDLKAGLLAHTFSRPILGLGSGHRDRITGLSFDQTGNLLASSSTDGSIKLWDMRHWQQMASYAGDNWGTTAIALSGDSTRLVSGNSTGEVRVFNLTAFNLTAAKRTSAKSQPDAILSVQRDRIVALALNPTGTRLIAASRNGTVTIWDLEQQCPLHQPTAHADAITDIAVDPNWRILVTGSCDRTVKLWDLSTGHLRHTLVKHRDGITAVAISADARTVATGSQDNQILLWDSASGSVVTQLNHTWAICSLSFAPNSTTLVSASQDETIKIWRKQEYSSSHIG
ncbi:MAG: protein kinase domain-containing protein [Thainema sp.]